jgi:hypothetical protein
MTADNAANAPGRGTVSSRRIQTSSDARPANASETASESEVLAGAVTIATPFVSEISVPEQLAMVIAPPGT